jgi:hypothetical protein
MNMAIESRFVNSILSVTFSRNTDDMELKQNCLSLTSLSESFTFLEIDLRPVIRSRTLIYIPHFTGRYNRITTSFSVTHNTNFIRRYISITVTCFDQN